MSVVSQLKIFPLEHILSAPLIGAIKAQAFAAHATFDYIEKVGFMKIGEGEGKKEILRKINFIYNTRTVSNDNGPDTVTDLKVDVPLLTLLPVPVMEIDNIDLNFSFDISEIVSNESTQSGQIDASFGYEGWGVKVNVNGKYAQNNLSYDKTERNANLTIKLHARQAPIPEGLSKLLEILNDQITKTEEPVTA